MKQTQSECSLDRRRKSYKVHKVLVSVSGKRKGYIPGDYGYKGLITRERGMGRVAFNPPFASGGEAKIEWRMWNIGETFGDCWLK